MARATGTTAGELTDTAMHVMLALTTPRHGYAAMQYLEEESDGEITLGPATLYTTLKKLVGAELIDELDGTGSRRTYVCTDRGREVLTANIERRRRLLAMADHIQAVPTSTQEES